MRKSCYAVDPPVPHKNALTPAALGLSPIEIKGKSKRSESKERKGMYSYSYGQAKVARTKRSCADRQSVAFVAPSPRVRSIAASCNKSAATARQGFTRVTNRPQVSRALPGANHCPPNQRHDVLLSDTSLLQRTRHSRTRTGYVRLVS